MSIEAALARSPLFRDTFLLHPQAGSNAYGEPTFGADVTVKGVAITETETVSDEGGLRQVTMDVVYALGAVAVPTGSEITVNGVRRRIVNVVQYPDLLTAAPRGAAATKLVLGATGS